LAKYILYGDHRLKKMFNLGLICK